jgi:hypothetical protein
MQAEPCLYEVTMASHYELIGISPDDLAAIVSHLRTLPNRQAQQRWVLAFASEHPAVDTRLIIQQIRSDDHKRQSGRRVVKQKSRNDASKQAFTGDGSNMRGGTSGGKAFLADHLWWAHAGATRAGNPYMEPVKGGVDDQAGKYGTNTQFLHIPESFTGLVR